MQHVLAYSQAGIRMEDHIQHDPPCRRYALGGSGWGQAKVNTIGLRGLVTCSSGLLQQRPGLSNLAAAAHFHTERGQAMKPVVL